MNERKYFYTDSDLKLLNYKRIILTDKFNVENGISLVSSYKAGYLFDLL